MTDKARETIAAICERHLPHPSDDEYLDAADAILAALPEIIKGMVQPLEWGTRKVTNDIEWYDEVCADTAFGFYTTSDARPFLGPEAGWTYHTPAGVRARGFRTGAEAQTAANAHNSAQVLEALGMLEGE